MGMSVTERLDGVGLPPSWRGRFSSFVSHVDKDFDLTRISEAGKAGGSTPFSGAQTQAVLSGAEGTPR